MTQLLLVERLAGPDIEGSGWSTAVQEARRHGWQPAGTRVDGLGPYWSGSYEPDEWPRPRWSAYLSADDAAGMAAALAAAITERLRCSDGLKRDTFRDWAAIADACSRGPVRVRRSDSSSTACHGCEEEWPVGLPFEHLHAARPAPWRPRVGFDPFWAFEAVRFELTGHCGEFLNNRLALARAICGYLGRHPQDATLDDYDLLGVVAGEFFAGPFNRELGAGAVLNHAAQQRRRGIKPGARLPNLEGAAPWWRAASILGDAETAVIACGMELLPREWEDLGDRGAGRPKVNFNRAQRAVFGDDCELWPGVALQRATPASERDIVSALVGIPEHYTEDIGNWEELTGVGLDELLGTVRPPRP